MTNNVYTRAAELPGILQHRIAILDGAMGTMIQRFRLDEEQYRYLQEFGPFDQKTSSWLKTPVEVRNHGGAIFGDYRYGRVFIYHNGVQSYYAARAFRGFIKI
jgi:hypothetical protein